MKKILLMVGILITGGSAWGLEEFDEEFDTAKKTKTFMQLEREKFNREHPFSVLWDDVASRLDQYLKEVSIDTAQPVPFDVSAYRFTLFILRVKLKFPSTTLEEKQLLLAEITNSIEKMESARANLKARYAVVGHDPKVIEANMSTIQEILDALNVVKNQLETQNK